ncbi:MAG: ATP-binding cassette domain-containing protein [Propionicimonas sp.]
MTSEAVVTTRGLTKRYGSVVAVADLDLEVRKGEIYAFLGRNGAGKTTTIRMILGLIRPDAGEVRVFGRTADSAHPEWLRRVGSLVETATAYPNLTVRENLDLHRRYTGAPARAVPDVIEQLGLAPVADRRAGQLSLGNKQRLSLARALVHAPALLVLDEPANALDPAGIVEIRQLLRSLADGHGTTVFVSSHILVEVAHLADRIGIVHAGRLIEELDREALIAAARTFSAEQLTDQQRADALLGLELERYFLARTDEGPR